MPHCAALGCNFQSKGNKGSDISIHVFPTDKKRRKKWEDACGRTQLPKNPRLCSRHFTPDAFEAFTRPQLVKQLTGAAGYKRRLKPDAFPTIFPQKESKRPQEVSEVRDKKRDRDDMLDVLLSRQPVYVTSSEHPYVRGGAGTGNGNGVVASGMDQITVVRIDDTHVTGEQVNSGGAVCYEMECTMPTEEVVVEDDEEEDNVFIIEYSNPEEEGESYQFTMSVDRSLPAKKPIVKPPVTSRELAPATPKPRTHGRKKPKVEEEEDEEEQQVKPEKKRRVLVRSEAAEDANESERTLKCPLCPSPGKFFRRASGLAVHLKHMHHKEGNKTFFCTTCQQPVRSQVELDQHTRRHAIKEAVFTCVLCTSENGEEEEETKKTTGVGYRGTRLSLKSHLKTEHPGVIPRCDICNRSFKTLNTYLADQFRHVGVSPYYCPECKIYEMTERGLVLHMKNDEMKRKKKMQQQQEGVESGEKQLQASGDNSATDDSDF